MKIRALLIFLIISSLFPVRVQAGVDAISKTASDEEHITNQFTLPGDNEYTEETEEIDEDQMVELPETAVRSVNNINCTIKAGSGVSTSYFSLQNGDKLKIHLIMVPNDQNIKVGYQKKSSTKAVMIKGKGTIGYTFTISQSGNYRVVMKNPGSQKVTVSGKYYY